MNRKWIWAMGFIAAALAAGWGYWDRRSDGSDAVEVRTARVVRGDIERTVLTTGVVEPQNRVEIKPPIGGRIEEILVREGDELRKGQIVAWMSSTERAALLDAARIKGPDEVARWAGMYKPAPLVAPITGTVIARNAEPGQSVAPTDAVLVMSDRLIVKAQVDETDIGMVRTGQKATVVLDAYSNEPVPAFVDHIAYEAQTVNNVTVYAVDVVPAESGEPGAPRRPAAGHGWPSAGSDRDVQEPAAAPAFMRSGMTANVSFQIDFRQDALLAPAESVRDRNGEKWVSLPGPNGKEPSRRRVETGITDGKRVEIVSGLEEGDEVLVSRPRMKNQREPERGSPFSPFGRPGGRGR